MQAAEALHHAHEQGVIHRDVKPSNLILDGGGRLWVADFGLARLANDVRLTRTGDIIGTLRYLSPEQSRGAPADYRADVYALGVTLYELLALEPPFASEDRHQLLRQIGAEEPRPPSRLNPRVPRDLETVVLKAMAKDPAERYATARDLADDLERFLAGRPVVARRPGPFDRAVKWAARNRVLVTTALAGLLLAVTALGFGLWREARMRRLEEMRARELRDAYDDIYSYVTDRWLYRQPRLEPDQRRVLEKMLTAYESFLRRWDDDPAVRENGAKVYRRVGDLRRKLGLDGAEAAYSEAIRLLGAPAGQEARYELAGCHNNLAHLWQAAGRLADAESAYAEAGRLFGELARDAPKVSEHWDGLAGTTMNLGLVRRRLGRPREAEEPLRDAVTILRRTAAEFPDAPAYERGLAAGLSNLGDLYREAGRPGEAEPLYREAIRRQEALLGRHPSEPDFRELHGTTCHGLGLLLAAAGKPDEATAVLDKAADVRRRLAADFPLVAEYRQALDATRRASAGVRARHTP